MRWWWMIAGALLAASPAAGQPPDTTPDALPPKVAVVVSGDPDETIRNVAAFVQNEATLSGLRAPTDPALVTAMRGEPATEEDGLEGLRSLRRGLGLDPAKDLAAYQRIGMIAGADALVVVRRQGPIVIEVFDVTAAQFYEGTMTFDQSSPEERVRFIQSRAEQAKLRWSKPTPSTPSPPPPDDEAKGSPPVDKVDDSRAKRRWKKAWPYVVAGALLAGGVTYLIIDRRRTDVVAPPLLRFRPGEE